VEWLLRTKLTPPPPRADLVARPRLMELIGRGLRGPLTLVSAPAGFGKTTLVAEWRASPGARPLAWVALDETDSDPTRFWGYVLAALQTLDQELGDGADQMLRSPQPAPLDAVVAALLRDLTFLTEEVVLALDDYHLIESEAVHRSLTFMVEHLPPRLHVVLLTRTDPPLPLSRMRARGQLVEVRAGDLRFRADEAERFLSETMGLALAPADVQALEAGTEGWVAGLQLAALSLRGRSDPAEVIRGFGPGDGRGAGSHRYVVDYLVEEVLQRQPPDVQAFLTQTAVLDRLSGSLCDAVTDEENGQVMLEQLERQNLFLVPLDEERRWYRYHHLFTGALRFRLRQTEPELLPELHLRAAAWYDRHGLLAEAVGHALSGDPERAAELIGRASDELLRSGQMATLRGWIEALPEEVVRARLGLCISHAWTLLVDGRIDLARRRAEQAERLIEAAEWVSADGDEGRPLARARGQVLATQAHVALVGGDVVGALEMGHRALELLPPHEGIGRGVTAITLGFAHQLQGDWIAAEADYRRAAEIGAATGNLLIRLSALGCVSELRAVHGQLRRSAEIARQIVREAGEGRRQPLPLSAVGHVGLAYCHREWNEIEAAERHARAALDLAPDTGVQVLVSESWLVLALVLLARGDRAGATDAAERAGEVSHGRQEPRGTAGSRERVAAVAAHLAIGRGDLERARAWAEESGISPLTGPHPLLELDAIVYARLRLAEVWAGDRAGELGAAARAPTGGSRRGDGGGGRHVGVGDESEERRAMEAVAALTARWGSYAEAGGRTFRAVGFGALNALARRGTGDRDGAVAALARALALAEPEGLIRTFADEGAPMAELLGELRAALRRGERFADMRPAAPVADETDPDAGYTFSLPEPAPRALRPPSVGYVERVLAATGPGSGTAAPVAPRRAQALVEPLSERELEVLALMAAGASNTDIADRLVVGMSTVKTHVNRIFRKLEAGSRTQAVAKGRGLGLIDR
jgi:LuxR family maltose regulon positive regulatory protein